MIFREEVFPNRSQNHLEDLWWMQDGVTAYTVNSSMAELHILPKMCENGKKLPSY